MSAWETPGELTMTPAVTAARTSALRMTRAGFFSRCLHGRPLPGSPAGGAQRAGATPGTDRLRLHSRSGHTPGSLVSAPVGERVDGANPCFSATSMLPALPLRSLSMPLGEEVYVCIRPRWDLIP